MPQLAPFYFVNQVIFAFTILTIITFILSKYILPKFIRTYSSRLYMKKL